jgi:hypothetical protein
MRWRLRGISNPVVPAIAIAVVVAVWAIGRSQSGAELYVLYHGQRLPISAAGGYSCHDLARPQIRCFDTFSEMRADIVVSYPERLVHFDRLWSQDPESSSPE